jgi:anti-sigma factor RsiW
MAGTGSVLMDHHYIEEHNVPDRYLLGKLPAEERARFEEHFIDCQECLDRLETTEDFRGALRSVAAEGATRGYAQAGLLARMAWMMRLSRVRRAALILGAILLLAALPVALWIKERGRAREELAQFRTSSAALQRQYEESQQAVERLERELQESQRQSGEQRRQLETQLERERQERARLADELEKFKRPQAALPIFILSMARSGGAGQPVNRISLPRSSPRIILSLELEEDPDLQSYRATLLTADNRRIWSASNLRPDSKDALGLTVNTDLFKPGDYLLILEGLTGQGRYVPVAKYPFQAIKQ